ncbi:MAG: outer membrane protein [Xanthobacteraceae bacterium]
MQRIVIAAISSIFLASILAASRVTAADLPVRTEAPAYYPAVAPIYDWGGGYIGINGGYAFGQSQWGADALNPSGLSSTGNFNVNGGMVGVTAGVSGQWGPWVLGAEGDFDWQGVKGTSNSPFCTSLITSTVPIPIPPTPAVGIPAGLSCKTASTWLGTFRGRAGYAWDRVLVFGTAGIAGANVQTGLNGLPPQTNFDFGWTAGAGLEWAFADHWTFKVEYLFVDLGNVSCNHGYSCGYDAPATTTGGPNPTITPVVNSNSTVKLNENLIRVGVNFKWGH